MGIFRKFRDISAQTTPKITFIALLLTNFTKISKKVFKNFFSAFAAEKTLFSQFFAPPPTLVDGTPPWRGAPNNHILIANQTRIVDQKTRVH